MTPPRDIPLHTLLDATPQQLPAILDKAHRRGQLTIDTLCAARDRAREAGLRAQRAILQRRIDRLDKQIQASLNALQSTPTRRHPKTP